MVVPVVSCPVCCPPVCTPRIAVESAVGLDTKKIQRERERERERNRAVGLLPWYSMNRSRWFLPLPSKYIEESP